MPSGGSREAEKRNSMTKKFSNIASNIIYYTTSDDIILCFDNEDVFGGAKILSNTYSSTKGYGTIEFDSEVTAIEQEAFCEKTTLTYIALPNSVTSIGDDAFYKCSGLTSVTIGNSVTSIGEQAFCDCSGLTSVTIPNSVTSIGVSAFEGCSGLKSSVTIPNSVTSIGGSAFEGCKGLTSVTIGNGVELIRSYSFAGCSGLTSVTIGNGVERIWSYIFSGCSALKDVYCYAEKVPSTYNDAFRSSNYLYATLHVPAGSIEKYKAQTPWSNCGKIVALTDEETGIEELKSENGNVKTAIFDLSGRRVQKAQKGIFIQNEKKVIIK